MVLLRASTWREILFLVEITRTRTEKPASSGASAKSQRSRRRAEGAGQRGLERSSAAVGGLQGLCKGLGKRTERTRRGKTRRRGRLEGQTVGWHGEAEEAGGGEGADNREEAGGGEREGG